MNLTSLDYLDVCLTELNSTHQFYFDAGDVIDILNGVHLFYESEKFSTFQSQIFSNENRVAQALAYGGFLGTGILLLPPHQVELSDKVKSGLFEPMPHQNYIKDFWESDLNYLSKFETFFSNDVSKINNSEIEEWVKTKGKDLFKAIYFSYKTSWQERLVEIFDKEYFQICEYNSDDIEIYDQELFNELLDIFSNKVNRAAKSENNYRDVLALMYLAKKVKQYNKNQKLPIPVYFDSQNFLSHIPERLLKDHFTLRDVNNKFIHRPNNFAFRNVNYFKIFSLLKYNKNFPDVDKKYENFATQQNVISEIKQRLDDLEFTIRVVGSKEIFENERIELFNKISNYIDYDFFNRILLDFISEKNGIIKKVFDDIKIKPIKDEIIAQLKNRIDSILKNLTKEINELTNFSAATFNLIDKRVDLLRLITDKIRDRGKDFDVFNDYSLFRFFVPDIYQNDIRLLFSSDGLLSKDSKTYKGAIVSIWYLFFRTSSHGKNELNEGELFKLVSVFWVLNLHDKIFQIHIKDDDVHHSLLMLKGACLNRAINEYKRENKSITGLIEDYYKLIFILQSRSKKLDKSSKGFDYGEISIALSYLYFHLWLQNGHELVTEKTTSISYSNKDKEKDNLTAIAYAKGAFDFFNEKTSKENRHRVYSLNIYVYYIIDSASDDEYERITPLINELISLKAKTNGWHFRYDDTIARNFHRRSLIVKSKYSKITFAKNSLSIIEETLLKNEDIDGRDIKEVESYKLRLQNYLGELDSMKE